MLVMMVVLGLKFTLRTANLPNKKADPTPLLAHVLAVTRAQCLVSFVSYTN